MLKQKIIRLFMCIIMLMFSITKPITVTQQCGMNRDLGDRPIKVLHLSFHKGCCNDFAEVAEELGLELTTWYILGRETHPLIFFDGKTHSGNAVYNIGHDRAKAIWEIHKDFFNQFDVIVTSDTAPLSRIFLQNNWKKPLIIWVCNRFDYYDAASLDCAFPDSEYYNLFRRATKMPNVKIVSYTPYEHHYMREKGIPVDNFTIRPLGTRERHNAEPMESYIPDVVDKGATLFLYPRLEQRHVRYIQDRCKEIGIATYSGVYNGPDDLKKFKGILYIPYAWSNLALFEHLQRGFVHFVPSEKFMMQAFNQGLPIRIFTKTNFHLCDWYCDEFHDLFIYFDSWQDLKNKVESINYEQISDRVKSAGILHRENALRYWHEIFDYFTQNYM